VSNAKHTTRVSPKPTGNGALSVTEVQTQIPRELDANEKPLIGMRSPAQIINCFPCCVTAKTLAKRQGADGAVVNAAVTWGLMPNLPFVVPLCGECVPTQSSIISASGGIGG
jgi:hypothetical protein